MVLVSQSNNHVELIWETYFCSSYDKYSINQYQALPFFGILVFRWNDIFNEDVLEMYDQQLCSAPPHKDMTI